MFHAKYAQENGISKAIIREDYLMSQARLILNVSELKT